MGEATPNPHQELNKAFRELGATIAEAFEPVVEAFQRALDSLKRGKMYDPLTVAFDFGFFVIWHRDPNGGDLCYGPYHERLHLGHRGINPRWHLWHWEFQIPILQDFKRWVWTRCARCGEGFRWRETPCTHQWEGEPCRWFRGEEKVYHYRCLHEVDQMRIANNPSTQKYTKRHTK